MGDIVEGEIVLGKKYTLSKRDRAFMRKITILNRVVEMKLDLTTRYTMKQISAAVGVPERTLKRWLSGELFERMFEAVKKERMTPLRVADAVDRSMPEIVQRVTDIALHGEPREAIQAARFLKEFWKEDTGRPEEFEPTLRPV